MKNQYIFSITIILLCTISSIKVLSQDWSLTGNAGTNPTSNFVGTTDNYDLVFRTNNTEKARILSGGNVGIGTTNPLNLLTVSGGHIDVSSGNKQYMISNTPVLWHGGNTSNIYVGVTGVNASNTGTDNTFAGYSAGSSITSGRFNTCIGSYAGQDIEDSKWNVCVGYQAGFSLKTV